LARYGPHLDLPYLVTVHDLIRQTDLERSGPFIHALSRHERRMLHRDRAGMRAAAGLIAVSEHTGRELQSRLGIEAGRIAVVYQGIDQESFQPHGGSRPLSDPYLLFVGSEQPRKNLAALLAAFAGLKAESEFKNLRLVKVGSPGCPEAPYRAVTIRGIEQLGLRREVLFTGRISDEELARWYSHAACLVLPSLNEGFALPPLEAMSCGCPVVVSNQGSLPEIAGPGALVADGVGAAEILAACRTVLIWSTRCQGAGPDLPAPSGCVSSTCPSAPGTSRTEEPGESTALISLIFEDLAPHDRGIRRGFAL